MPEDSNTIKIIAGPPPAAVAAPLDYVPPDAEGQPHGEEHALSSFFTTKPIDKLTSQIDSLRDQLGTLVQKLAQSFKDNVELEEVTVGLAITVEGDIGIASAGAEASLELTFKVKP